MLGPHWVAGFSLVAVSGGSSLAAVLVLLFSRSTGSGTHRLSCCGPQVSFSTSRGVFLDQGSNLCLLPWQVGSLPLSHQASPLHTLLMWNICCGLVYYRFVNSLRTGTGTNESYYFMHHLLDCFGHGRHSFLNNWISIMHWNVCSRAAELEEKVRLKSVELDHYWILVSPLSFLFFFLVYVSLFQFQNPSYLLQSKQPLLAKQNKTLFCFLCGVFWKIHISWVNHKTSARLPALLRDKGHIARLS